MNSLEQKTILVQLKISTWTGRKKDKLTTEEVLNAAQAERDAGSWWTYLVPKNKIVSIETKAHQIRNIHYKWTLPWIENARILTLEAFLDYQEEISKAISEFNYAVDSFLKEYPARMQEYTQRLGKLTRSVQLPTVEEIKNKYKVSIDTLPFPSTTDFRLQIVNQSVEEQIKQQIEQSIDEKIKSASTELYSRMREMLAKVHSHLDKNLRDATIQNLLDFCKLVPKLNFIHDDKLNDISKEVTCIFATVSAKDIKTDKVLRYNIKKQISDLLERIK